ncbi:lasso RiPP family leader peptide-containing protein [Kitasatospora sp. NPDC001574]
MENADTSVGQAYEVPVLVEVGGFADLTRASSSGSTIDGGATPWIYRNDNHPEPPEDED